MRLRWELHKVRTGFATMPCLTIPVQVSRISSHLFACLPPKNLGAFIELLYLQPKWLLRTSHSGSSHRPSCFVIYTGEPEGSPYIWMYGESRLSRLLVGIRNPQLCLQAICSVP